MKIATLVFLCGAALVTGAPTDAIISETELFQVEVDAANKFDAHAVAKSAIVELLQTGKDDDACKELANASISQVEQSIEAEQKIIDVLSDGSECPSVGQEAVDGAQKAFEEATKAKTDADAALEAAQAAPVTFAPVPYNALSEGKCDFFFSDPAYIAAMNARAKAQEEEKKARGAVDVAQKALEEAKAAQAKAIKECECKVRADYDKVWAAASAATDADADANEKAYTKGKHMLCILDHVTPDKCDVGTVPTLIPKTLADNVPPSGDPSCIPPTAAPTVSPTAAPTVSPTAAPTVPPTARPTVRPTARPTAAPTFRPNLYRRGATHHGWGGYCQCPNGVKYAVSDSGNACGSIECHGGTRLNCHRHDGPWSKAAVWCGQGELSEDVALYANEVTSEDVAPYANSEE